MKNHVCARSLVLIIAVCLFCFAGTSCAKNDGYVAEPNYFEEGFDETEKTADDVTVGEKNDKIIKTYSVVAETLDYDAALAKINTLTEEFGGYAETSSFRNESLGSSETGRRTASFTLRIPAEKAEDFLSRNGESLNVTRMESQVENKSKVYYSAAARLEELQAERDSLLQMLETLDSAAKYDLWLSVTERLSAVRQEIAVCQTELERIDSQVAYSTIKLELREVEIYSEDRFGSRVGNALRTGWSDFCEGLGDFVVTILGILPGLVIFLVILPTGLVIGQRLYRRWKKKRLELERKIRDSIGKNNDQNQNDEKK